MDTEVERASESSDSRFCRLPSGRHMGKRLGDLTDHILLCVQGSWMDNARLRSTPFFAKIQSEVARRGLRVLEVGKKSKRSTAIIENELRRLNGGQIPAEKLDALKVLLAKS